MLTQLPPTRCRDRYGAGYFGASRGKRKHNGVDFVIQPGTQVCAFQRGTVTKLGYCYAKHPQYRYVEITDSRGYRCRYFYVCPAVSDGSDIDRGSPLGTAQDLAPLYPGITPHIHFEVMTMKSDGIQFDDSIVWGERVYHNPFKYLAGDL